MALQLAEVIFKDAPSRHNRELTDFLFRNLKPAILKGQVKFKFRVAKVSELESLRGRGINRLPAMILQNKSFIGVPHIIEELQKRVQKSRGTAPAKTEEEMLSEYMQKTIECKKNEKGEFDIPNDDDDDDVDGGAQLESAARKEAQRRGLAKTENNAMNKFKREPPPNPPDRTAIADNDYEDRDQPRKNNKGGRGGGRADNIEMDPGDPTMILNRMAPNEDDDLMQQLLAKMNGGMD